MSMFSWLRRSPRRLDARSKCRPQVEMLENRWVPAAVGTATQNFVDQVYRDLLHRAPDAGGLQSWSQQIDSGRLSRQEFVLQIEGSDEGLRTQVNDQYVRLLGRPADANGQNGWVNYLRDHTTEELEVQLVSSQEYFQTQGGSTNTGYITSLYQDFLGRTPSAAEINSWNSQASVDRQAVARGIVFSQEARTDEVRGFYTSYLRRTGDQPGINYWSNLLNQGNADKVFQDSDQNAPNSVENNDDAIIVSYFLSSQEYFQHSQTLTTASFATVPGPV